MKEIERAQEASSPVPQAPPLLSASRSDVLLRLRFLSLSRVRQSFVRPLSRTRLGVDPSLSLSLAISYPSCVSLLSLARVRVSLALLSNDLGPL